MSTGLNLAKRPFVDTRPVTAAAVVLVLVVGVLSVISVRTIQRYLQDSSGTSLAIATLKEEAERTEHLRQKSESALARFDLDELGANSADANLIAGRRAFSWTRFLSRVEQVLPSDIRVVSISLSKPSTELRGGQNRPADLDSVGVQLSLISRDPIGLVRTIRALYASPYFDMPIPRSDVSPEKGSAEGRQITMEVLYLDGGKKS
ncbi:MAG: hypothetical protein ABIQ65_06585 [Thermoanaerobaculia bacterium]